MAETLTISLGHCSDKGRKEVNQDFHGALIPSGPALALKGISVLISDGISSSSVSQEAAESAVKSFLTDYYATAESWSVKTAALRVIRAANSWLYAQTRRSIHSLDMDKGYVCTLSALVLKGRVGHIFHVGDSRVYRLQGAGLEPLTQDHRNVVSPVQSYLARAMGMAQTVDVDYHQLPLAVGDVFILATDGVFEHCPPRAMAEVITKAGDDLSAAAKAVVAAALENGSEDNLTIQIVRIDSLPPAEAGEALSLSDTLPPPPLPEPGQVFEGYRVLRQLHSNHRSHIFLVEDAETDAKAALKIPAMDLRQNSDALQRFMMEDWVARRVKSAHLLRAFPLSRPPQSLYSLSEYIEGQTLAQWMIDNPRCTLSQMREIISQVAKGLRALHRKEMLHRDLRPENIMIDQSGTVKIIDFGAVRIAGVQEALPALAEEGLQGALQYAAPEYFIGAPVGRQADYYALGVIAYQMLTGRLPYGPKVSRLSNPRQLAKLKYSPARAANKDVPDWLDAALAKAVHPLAHKRYGALSEFVADLHQPNPAFRPKAHTPLAERNPVAFWQGVSALLALALVAALMALAGGGGSS